jgi:hypothetical protein
MPPYLPYADNVDNHSFAYHGVSSLAVSNPATSNRFHIRNGASKKNQPLQGISKTVAYSGAVERGRSAMKYVRKKSPAEPTMTIDTCHTVESHRNL